MDRKHWLIAGALVIGGTADGYAQSAALAAADSALDSCAALAKAGQEKASAAQAVAADRAFDAAMREHPADALTGKARVLSQCRVPFAALLRKGAVIDESNNLLRRALSVDSMHLAARFTLALNHYHVPEFFGRTDDARRELETLVAQYGARPIPVMALVYLYLGDVYMRKGQKSAAVNTWRRGEELHPDRAAQFQQKLAKAGASAGADASRGTNMPVYDLDPIVVEAGRFSVDDTRGAASLKRMDIVTMPGGTADVLQVFQAMPGVTRATEGSDLYVRGGDASEAPVFVDGARMTYAGAFETLHGGIFGVLDPNAIKKAEFSSGGFSVRYGNALSGILDITTEGRAAKQAWRAGVNLISAGSSIRRPLGPSTGAWVTGKVTQTGALLWTQGKRDVYPRTPWSMNAMAGAAYAPTERFEVKGTVLTESDDAARIVDVLGYTGTLHSRGATHMAVLSARLVDSEATASLRASLSGARRTTAFTLGVLDRDRHDDMFTMRVDADLSRNRGVRVRAGLEAVMLDGAETGTVPAGAELAPGSEFHVLDRVGGNASHAGAYAETEVSVTSKLAFIAGMRADRLPAAEEWSTDPRIALAYRTRGWTVRSGAGIFHQGAWRTGYRTPNPGAPSRVATRARHIVFGLERESPVFLRVEAFAKSYDDYASIAGTTAPEMVAQGPALDRGSARGIDALVRWRGTRALSGWASYSYLDGDVRLRDARTWIPSAVDVRHTFTGVGKLAFGENWEIGTTARLATGRPYTPIAGARTNADGSLSALYGPTHSGRMPDYMRLDTRLTRLVPTRAGGLLAFYLEGLNLLDRANVMSYTYDASYTRRLPVESFFANRTLVFGAEAMF